MESEIHPHTRRWFRTQSHTRLILYRTHRPRTSAIRGDGETERLDANNDACFRSILSSVNRPLSADTNHFQQGPREKQFCPVGSHHVRVGWGGVGWGGVGWGGVDSAGRSRTVWGRVEQGGTQGWVGQVGCEFGNVE